MKSVSDLIGNEYLEWKLGIPYILSSQTGRGKTTFVMTRLLKYAAAQNKDVLYICNRKALHAQVDQIVTGMTQSFKNSFSLTEEESKHLVIQTYQACETKMESPFRFSGKLYVIFDEAHYFLEDASFNSRTNLWSDWIRKFYDASINAETPICVFMTATPESLKCFLANAIEKPAFPWDRFFAHIMESDKDKSKVYAETDGAKQKLQSFDAYGEGKEYIRKAIVSCNDVHEICSSQDYSYVEERYFRAFTELVDIISRSKEKWIIFINDLVKGQQYVQQLNDLGIETVFISASLKNKSASQQLEQLESLQSFSCRVLIATSILDCGVNILDDAVQNVVIFEITKTKFVQMLGRVRIQAGKKIRLFIKAPTALDVRDCLRYTCKDIRMIYNFYMLQKKCLFGNGLTLYNNPPMSMAQRERFLQSLKGSNYKIIYLKHNLLVGRNWINQDIIRDWKEGKVLAEYEMNHNLLLYLLYVLYCFNQAKEYTQEGEVDDIYYLKYQLSWLGKKYDESRWVSYTRQRDEITILLDECLGNEDGMLSEEQEVFAGKVFELLCRMSVIPSTAKKNSSALKRTGHAPGKNILNKCFEEIGLPYVITSKSKMQDRKREQRWYVKRRDAKTDE